MIITFEDISKYNLGKCIKMIVIKTVPVSCDTAILSSSWPGDAEPSQDPSPHPSYYHSKPEKDFVSY